MRLVRAGETQQGGIIHWRCVGKLPCHLVSHRVKVAQQFRAIAVTALLSVSVFAQESPSSGQPSWPMPRRTRGPIISTVDGYIVPEDQSYVDPVLTADRNWLHLEARYNYENLRTGSLWVGYNFSAGKNVELSITPMIGGVFGRTNGIAPGFEASLAYRKFEFSISNEYIFDTDDRSTSFHTVGHNLLIRRSNGFESELLHSIPRLSTRRSTYSAVSWSAYPIRNGRSRPTFSILALQTLRWSWKGVSTFEAIGR